MTDSSPHSEASKLLEAALEQMDGIIQGAKFDLNNGNSTTTTASSASTTISVTPHNVGEVLKSSKNCLYNMNDAQRAKVQLDETTRLFLWDWLKDDLWVHNNNNNANGDENGYLSRMEERLISSENEKDSLQMQVSILNEEIERQGERIKVLERALHQRGSLSHQTDLERIKSEYQLNQMKLTNRIASLERENHDLRRKNLENLELSKSVNTSNSSPTDSTSGKPSSFINHEESVMDRSLQLPPKGFMKILGKMKRSSSGSHLDDSPNFNDARNSFRRGGSRATVGGRIEGRNVSSSTALLLSRKPFMEWNVDTLCLWMETLGLPSYNNEIRKNIVDGKNFSSLNIAEYELKLGMKNPLHRKKVYLALNARVDSSKNDTQGNLDHQWVLRWLDDVGLPQYKEIFLECRIDGRVLNMLTVDDLFYMKITNQLHHLSLKRGIQVLRSADFDPNCLTRRALRDQDVNEDPSDVSLWSNYRIMEWLKQVDLSEYSPNLRGSGVHGGLFIYEPRFNDELLASLLSIPNSKTLLRRHLSIRFKELVGKDVMFEKRNVETEFQPLTPTTKAKFRTGGAGQFSLKRKKSKSLFDYDDLLCPYIKSIRS